MPGDSEDPNDEEQYHLGVGPDDVADAVLLPGDPDRVDKITALWSEAETVANHREYRTATGTYRDAPVSVTSTGIGAPSAAIAVEELARLGVDTCLRVGSCGAIQPGMEVGDLVITTGAVRQEGTSAEYVREDYPAVADAEVVTALVTAAERLGYDYHTGVTMSADSFYTGQGRPGFEGYQPSASETLVDNRGRVQGRTDRKRGCQSATGDGRGQTRGWRRPVPRRVVDRPGLTYRSPQACIARPQEDMSAIQRAATNFFRNFAG